MARNENIVDGRNPAPAQVGSLSHLLRCFIHPNGGCCGIFELSRVSPDADTKLSVQLRNCEELGFNPGPKTDQTV